MKGGRNRDYLTSADFRQAFFLTLILTVSFQPRPAHSDAMTDDPLYKQRVSEVTTYLRKQALQGASILPGDVREAMGWFSGGWHAVTMPGGDDEAEGVADAAPDEAAQKLTKEIGTPLENTGSSPWHFAATLHHKGFLPTHDAAVMGVGFQHSTFDNKMMITIRPFYGQNWLSLRGYWGAEMTLDIAKKEDGMPWGKMVIGYVGGNDKLTDHGTGIDLHGDVDLTHNVQFTSGLKQNSADGNSDYAMLRWRMAIDPD
ncbi:MAG: hypothetical protein P4M15_14890 [Alphaproteobacteria bacterium]|nr:hypothetical protein [Alphaproteobacteria bacterium]